MLKTHKKSIIHQMISQNKLSQNQADSAISIREIFLNDSLIGRQVDSSQKIYIDKSTSLSGADSLQNESKMEQRNNVKEWKNLILSGQIDPLIYHICYSILHYNISPQSIAQEFTDQLHNKSTGSLLKRLELKVSTYKIEKMFKQGLDLFTEISLSR